MHSPRPEIFAGLRQRAITRRRRSEEHTSELQSRRDLVCRLLLEKKMYGPGRLGSAIVSAATMAGWDTTIATRPNGTRRSAAPPADVVVDASRGDAVLATLDHALD